MTGAVSLPSRGARTGSTIPTSGLTRIAACAEAATRRMKRDVRNARMKVILLHNETRSPSHSPVPRSRSADGEQVSCVLRVEPSVRTDRDRGVRRAEGQLQEDLVLEDAALRDRVEIAVLAVCVDRSAVIDGGGVHAPFEAVRLLVDAGHVTVRTAAACLRVRALELPFLLQIRIELRDVVSLLRVEVFLHHDRIRSVVLPDRGCRVPAEIVVGQNGAG